jgi:hypothetical protein
LDIVTTVKDASVEDISPTSSAEVIRTLEEKITALESATAIREQGSALLTKYGETLTGEHVSPEQMDKFLNTYLEHEKKRLEEVRPRFPSNIFHSSHSTICKYSPRMSRRKFSN